MNSDSQLLVGAVLIGIGLLLALLAYFVFTGRDRDESPQVSTEVGEPSEEPVYAENESEGDDRDARDHEVEMEPVEDVEPAMETPSEKAEPPRVDIQPAVPAPTAPSLSVDHSRIPVAIILRDDVTGALIVKVGEREYKSASELVDTKDYTRVKHALTDLSQWFPEAKPMPVVVPREPEKPAAEPRSMIEQINHVLQQKLAETGQAARAVRLIEGPGGVVRVLVGVQSYTLDEVPDEEINRLIREAVAAWEDNP